MKNSTKTATNKKTGEPHAVGRARLTTKGQVTIPKAVRERMDIREGDEVIFVADEKGRLYLRRVPVGFQEALERWQGYVTDLAGVDVDELIEEMRGR